MCLHMYTQTHMKRQHVMKHAAGYHLHGCLASAEPLPFVEVHRGFDNVVSVETLLLQHYSDMDCTH